MSKLWKFFFASIFIVSVTNCYFENLLLKIAFWQLKGIIGFSLIDFIKDISSIKKLDPYAEKRAKVRTCSHLCRREYGFLNKRKFYVKKGLEKFLGTEIAEEQLPTIGLCFSGGGYRSMIGTLAFLNESHKVGLLDAVDYISTLSGSTWALATWLGHDLAFDQLIALTRNQISSSIIDGIDRRLLLENCIWKLFYRQKMSLVGIWGSIVANVLFSDFEKNYIGSPKTRILRGKMPKLSQFRAKIDQGSYPMPLFTAVSVSSGYKWFEFSPYEVGLIDHNIYVPSWSFGRHFAKGRSTDYPPEHGIDYLMGIWGSAFTASLGEILDNCFDKKFLDEVNSKEENDFGLGADVISAQFRSEFLKLRLSPAKIKNIAGENSMTFLTLVDAGIDFNLPVPPLLKKERKLDLIIIYDLSSNADTAKELKYVEKYAIKNGYKFPKIKYAEIGQSTISVFEDPDPQVPVVIYMPMIKNDAYSKLFDPKNLVQGGYCSTFNLQYTPQQFDELFGLIGYNTRSSMENIRDAIKFVIARKNKVILNQEHQAECL